MKYLSHYMNSGQSALFKEKKVFFAFSQKQLNEGIEKHNLKGIKLINLGQGMFCPRVSAKAVLKALDCIYKLAIEQDLKENGKEKVILRELYNHECFYTGDITDCIEKLSDYPITEEEIKNVYLKN